MTRPAHMVASPCNRQLLSCVEYIELLSTLVPSPHVFRPSPVFMRLQVIEAKDLCSPDQSLVIIKIVDSTFTQQGHEVIH